MKTGPLPTPTIINVPCSGTIQRGSIVEWSRVNSRVEPASANTTYTMIFGVALDYVEGASDTYTKVIPFVPGQLWEIDLTNTPTTAQIFLRHALTDASTLNNTASDVDGPTGVFIANALSTLMSNIMIGEFIRVPISQR